MLDDYKTQKFGGLGKEECIARAYSVTCMIGLPFFWPSGI